MRPKSMMLLLLALGCGLVASIGISQVINRNHDAAPAEETESILVAAKDIKVTEPLSDKNVKTEEWPKSKIPPDTVRDFKEVEKKMAGSTILAGEPIRKAKFAVDKRMDTIPPGYRVYAVPADASTTAGNLLQPGDRVDVLLAVKPSVGASGHVARTILQDVRVFAVNEQWRPPEGASKSDETIAAKTVSLLVTPVQAEVLAVATEMGGHIRLSLRNATDQQVADTDGTQENEVLRGSSKSDRNKEWNSDTDKPSDKTAGVL